MKRLPLIVFVFITGLSLTGFIPGKGKSKDFQGYEQAGGGSYFRLIEKGGETQTVEIGGLVFVKFKHLNETDSVLDDINAETQRLSYPIRVDSMRFKGDFMDLFMRLHAGDSAWMFFRLDSLKKYYPKELNYQDPKYKKMTYLGMAVRVDSIYSAAQTMALRKKQLEELHERNMRGKKSYEFMTPIREKAKQREPYLVAHNDSLLQLYLAQHEFVSPPDKNDIYYKELAPGSGGPIAVGSIVSVRFTGTYLDGTIFDSNWLIPEQDLMMFRLGKDPMIPGWDNCIQRMQKGGKAIFILPPAMAYNDGLTRIFEVEIVDVK